MAVQFDVEGLVRALRGRAVGVIATPAGWLPGLGALNDVLVPRATVKAMLALEHGLRGDLQDGALFDTYTDERTGIPVYSFYGGTGHTFPRAVFNDLDVIVFHAQDVSNRAYTYQQTLAATLIAAAETGTDVIVLDRPAPLAYLGNRGPLWTQFFPEPIPVIHGFTLGELGRWLVRHRNLPVCYDVLPVQGWNRAMTWRETGLPWIPPSPNLPFVDSAVCYSCTGIIQHTNLSEGRGCCKPFEYIGAPFVRSAALADRLNAAALPGLVWREVYFQPAFNKYQGQVCAGVHLMVQDERQVDPLRTQLTLLKALAEMHPDQFELKAGFGRWLEGGEWTVTRLLELSTEAFLAAAAPQAAAFTANLAPDLLYARVVL
jgi:uncharacterized protein YbbC (DUF1343 family)